MVQFTITSFFASCDDVRQIKALVEHFTLTHPPPSQNLKIQSVMVSELSKLLTTQRWQTQVFCRRNWTRASSTRLSSPQFEALVSDRVEVLRIPNNSNMPAPFWIHFGQLFAHNSYGSSIYPRISDLWWGMGTQCNYPKTYHFKSCPVQRIK